LNEPKTQPHDRQPAAEWPDDRASPFAPVDHVPDEEFRRWLEQVRRQKVERDVAIDYRDGSVESVDAHGPSKSESDAFGPLLKAFVAEKQGRGFLEGNDGPPASETQDWSETFYLNRPASAAAWDGIDAAMVGYDSTGRQSVPLESAIEDNAVLKSKEAAGVGQVRKGSNASKGEHGLRPAGGELSTRTHRDNRNHAKGDAVAAGASALAAWANEAQNGLSRVRVTYGSRNGRNFVSVVDGSRQIPLRDGYDSRGNFYKGAGRLLYEWADLNVKFGRNNSAGDERRAR
jgi:hypothetical protein